MSFVQFDISLPDSVCKSNVNINVKDSKNHINKMLLKIW